MVAICRKRLDRADLVELGLTAPAPRPTFHISAVLGPLMELPNMQDVWL
jgi:hypothetical protein